MHDRRPRSFLAGLLRGLWTILDEARRAAANLLFLALLIGLALLLAGRGAPRVAAPTALVLAPQGEIVEQLAGEPLDRVVARLTGRGRAETLLADLVAALDAAADDDRVQVVLLDLDAMGETELPKLEPLRKAIERVKTRGKRVIASADSYGQSQFYLAAAADEVYLHPFGMVLVTGYGSYRNYYREALQRLEVDWHVFRVGEYKSAPEPYLRDDMSPEARADRARWLEAMWRSYRDAVASARGIAPEALDGYVQRFPDALAAHDGDAAEAARATGLVDELLTRDQVRQRLIARVGADETGHSFRGIDADTYLAAAPPSARRSSRAVALIVAQGTILDGSQPPGLIGGDSTARLIRQAREDASVKAVVLRIDSPGGSAFASEIIRREVELTEAAGKPVVASMGGVAASGGYWIAMAAEEIWASPTTITGSIGIFGMVPTFQRTLARFGVHNDGVGTSPLAGTLRPDRTLPPEAVNALQLLIDRGYQEFIHRAAAGRRMTPEQIDAVARGRVWLGSEAQRIGLVDQLGDLDDAIAAAAARAGLGEDYAVRTVEPQPSLASRLLAGLLTRAESTLGPIHLQAVARTSLVERLAGLVEDEVGRLGQLNDPQGIYAYCFCEVE